MFKNRSTTSHHPKTLVFIAATAIMVLLPLLAVVASSPRPASAETGIFSLNNVVASTTGLNLRDQPSTTGALVATMPVNGRAIVIGGPFNSTWYWLNYNGTKGYANGRYLTLVDQNFTPAPTETQTAVSQDSATPTATITPANPPAQPTAAATIAPASPTSTVTLVTPTPDYTAPTTPGDYTNLWIGEMAHSGNVRSGPGTDQRVIKGWWVGRRVLLYQAVTDAKGGVWYRVSEPPEPPMYVHASLVRKVAPVIFEGARFKGKWVNVNISQQVVTAYVDGRPVLVTLASTGKGKNPTELGVWKIYWRLPKQTMKGGNLAAGDFYELKDVPFPQYFHISGESLHGTYWHDNFGRPMSHGCVNLSTPISGWFYGWANIGTTVYVHN